MLGLLDPMAVGFTIDFATDFSLLDIGMICINGFSSHMDCAGLRVSSFPIEVVSPRQSNMAIDLTTKTVPHFPDCFLCITLVHGAINVSTFPFIC